MMASSSPSTAASSELDFYRYEIGANDLFNQVLPDEMLLRIFKFLDLISLVRCMEVNKRFRQVASTESLWKALSLKGVFPSLKVFDASDWLTHFGLKVEAVSVDVRKVISALKKYQPQIEGDAGWTLLTIPKDVTIEQLINLAAAPVQGNATPIQSQFPTLRDIKNISSPKTYQILITRNILQGSRALSIDAAKSLLKERGCEMPRAIEVLALLITTFVVNSERLYGHDPKTFTFCEEQLRLYTRANVIIGDFSPDGPFIFYYPFLYDVTGVAGVIRKF